MTTHCPTTGKIAYPNRPEAAKARDEIIRRDKRRMTVNVFQCQHCGNFHIGRTPPPLHKRASAQ